MIAIARFLKAKESADHLRLILTTIFNAISLTLSDLTWFPLASAISFELVTSPSLVALLGLLLINF